MILILALIGSLTSQAVFWTGWAVLGLFFYLAYSLILLKLAPPTFLMIAPFVALHFTEMIAGVAIENGSYMIEVSASGHPTGAFMRLALLYIVFFAVCLLVTDYIWPKIQSRFKNAAVTWEARSAVICLVMVVLVGLSGAYMLVYGLQVGFPVITHVDRFAFLDRATPIYKAILLNRIVIMPIIGSLFVVPRYRLISLAMLSGIIVVSVLFSEKFTSLLTMICLYAIPIGLVHVANGGSIKLRSVAILGLIISCITVPAVLNVYGATENPEAASQRFQDRATAQGELWFMADEQYYDLFKLDIVALRKDAATWLTPDQQQARKAGVEFGQYYVMEKFATRKALNSRLKAESAYVFAFFPYVLISMGVVGLYAVTIFVAAWITGIMLAMALALGKGRWIEALLYGRLMSSFYAMTTTGFFWNEFGIKSLVTLAATIVIGLVTDQLVRRQVTGAARPKIKVRVREH